MLLNRGTIDNLFERRAYVFFLLSFFLFFLLLLLHRKRCKNANTTPWYLWWSASSGKESLGPAILISVHTANWSRFVSNSRFKHHRKKMHIRQQRMERIIASGIRLLVARREVITHRTLAPAIINTSFGSRILQSAGRSLLLRRLQFFLPCPILWSSVFFLFFFFLFFVLLNYLGFKCPWPASAPRSLAGFFLSSFCSRYIKLFLKIDEEYERGITMQAIDGFVASNSQAF